jgi:hypothetical protein
MKVADAIIGGRGQQGTPAAGTGSRAGGGNALMRGLAGRLALLFVALATASCYDFQKDAPASPSELPGGRYVDVKVEYRQPAWCANVAARCDEMVVFFASWMKPGEEFNLADTGGHVWVGIARHVPVNWPPADEPHLVRVYDPHLIETPTTGVTAARLLIGGQAIYSYDSPGTPQESGIIYVDDNGVGRNPY